MVILDILKYKGKKIKNLLKFFNTCRKKFLHILFNISNITINIKKRYNKKILTFTFHHYWGAFCQGAFVWGLLS